MAKSKAKTEAGKQRHVASGMRAFKQRKLKSGSGETVTDPKQAIAIELHEVGKSRSKKDGKKKS